jgi:hypothetical protein
MTTFSMAALFEKTRKVSSLEPQVAPRSLAAACPGQDLPDSLQYLLQRDIAGRSREM